MAIYLSRKKGGTVATPITPSNSSPAQMTANTPVNPTANGYAIENYSSVTPSNASPTTLTSGDIVKFGGNGVAISGYTAIQPTNSDPERLSPLGFYTLDSGYNNGWAIASYTSIMPSSTPTSVSSGDIVQIAGSGVIVDSVPTPTSITPSDSSPVALSANTPVNPTTSGYAIKNAPASKTPSDSSPASVSSGAIIKASASGYLYSSSGLKKVKTGTFTTSTTATITVNCGFQPKYLAVEMDGNASSAKHAMYIYNYDTDSSSYYRANQANYPTTYTLPQTADNLIGSITSSGFTMTKTSPARTGRYFAIG